MRKALTATHAVRLLGNPPDMKGLLTLLCLGAILGAMAAVVSPAAAETRHSQYDALIKAHAKANAVPEALAHRVIMRESRYQADLTGHGGCIGLMQIKLGTAVVNLPFCHPLLVAAHAALVDNLLQGRFLMGIGAGILRTDAEALELLDADRNAILSLVERP